MDKFETKVLPEDDVGGFIGKTKPAALFIPKLDQK